jgi:hypothetical protein
MHLKRHGVPWLSGLVFFLLILAACQTHDEKNLNQTMVTSPTPFRPNTVTPTEPPLPTVLPTFSPSCYQNPPPENVTESYAIRGWQAFAETNAFPVNIYYFPADCLPNGLEQDARTVLFGNILQNDQVGLIVLNPIESGSLGSLYSHLIQHEYWQMGPEDYPAILADQEGMNKNLVFLRVDELNGDNTIIGDPLVVMTSLAEHEYIHIVQSRNNPDLAGMVWSDKDYQAFIEGYANIGNASSQRYYFETRAAIEILQSLDLMNRNGSLQTRLRAELEQQGLDPAEFKRSPPSIYDQHVRAFFLRVGGQAYIDFLEEGEISPLELFIRAGCGDLSAYQLMRVSIQ